MLKIGVLALQGAFIEHRKILETLGISTFEIRQLKDLNKTFDGLILPGGESTVMGKLLLDLKLFYPVKELLTEGLPSFGTCAGLILLAKNLVDNGKPHLSTMNITVKRNAYGRQLGSFYTEEEFKHIGKIPMTFIRAPYIESVGENVEIMAVVNNNIVAAKEKNQLVTAFHPELSPNNLIHKYFINSMVLENKHSNV